MTSRAGGLFLGGGDWACGLFLRRATHGPVVDITHITHGGCRSVRRIRLDWGQVASLVWRAWIISRSSWIDTSDHSCQARRLDLWCSSLLWVSLSLVIHGCINSY